LFLNDAGFAAVEGVTDPSDAYDMTQARSGDRWTFTFKDAKGRTGALSLTLPANLEAFFVDPQDGKQSGGGGPLLYKEWRFVAPLTATGIFKPTMAGSPTVRIVPQGRGNVCTDAEQFTHYAIIVSGPKAHYTLYGSLAKAAPAP